MKNLQSKFVLYVVALVLIFLPLHTFAALLYFNATPQTVSVGDTVTVSVSVNSQNVPLNVVEGTILFSASASSTHIESVEKTGSVLTLWPTEPTLSADGQSIAFVGGVPNGFDSSDAELFTITMKADAPGTITFTPQDIAAYENDGKGTIAPLSTNDLTITVVPHSAKGSGKETLEVIGLILLVLIIASILVPRKKKTYSISDQQ